MWIMKDEAIRKRLFEMQLEYKAEQRTLLEAARAIEDSMDDEKDTLYRKAAILGIRLASVDKVIEDIRDESIGDNGRLKALQRHNLDMLKLRYKPRAAGADYDALDGEVISQFSNNHIVLNSKPTFNSK